VVDAGNGLVQLTITQPAITERIRQAVEQSIQIVERRINELGTVEPLIQRQGLDRILVQVPGLQDPTRLKELLGKTAKMEFRMVDLTVPPDQAAGGRLPADSELLPSAEPSGQPQVIKKQVLVSGGDLTDAQPGFDQRSGQPIVSFKFNTSGSRKFAQATTEHVKEPFAIVLDGKVISAPFFESVISDGTSQISGNFTESSAKSLATSLKYGALPISFDKQKTTILTIGPSLAGDQLSAGITAGIAGLLLVMIYCLFYYRGLGLVVIASLLVAAATTYALVLLLAKSAGFTLTLPGIAGLIVAVGITADSFIVFFERIRDEMRAGKSMRVAVEAGWIRARGTCVAADSVSILAAVVLYIFAAGVVKGFAFALGLSTLIDLAVFFWFTHPMVSWLARFSFFNKGHKLSGLDAENLGLDRLPAGGRA